MSKLKKSAGNMYDWVTHTHSHLGGKCHHGCTYCYVQSIADKNPAMKELYSGDIKLIDSSIDVDYGKDKIIFIDHMNDLFAHGVHDSTVFIVLSHCLKYPLNKYVFQTKNPVRYYNCRDLFPSNSILGTTIETNRNYPCMGETPSVFQRIMGMSEICKHFETFITLEPILDFDVKELVDMILYASPTFVNIGADSKNHDLDEPTYEKVLELYNALIGSDVEVRKKLNLDRLERDD